MEYNMWCRNRILPFLHNRTILLTGATSSLAKVLIEKIIRVQPNVKKLYLLLRAPDSHSAFHRFNTQVLSKEVFGKVKEKYGEKYINSKIKVVSGDISDEQHLGIKQEEEERCSSTSTTLEELYGQVEVVINCAATTNFDERYDVALGINAIGAANVLKFSQKCSKLRVFVHVSTAYVCGEKGGVILETPLKLGDSLNGVSSLDILTEQQIVKEALETLKANHALDKDIAAQMKHLGLHRARMYGWPNTYSFTKAMGEMLLGDLKQDTPLVIIRPSIITSTYKEPFPGWLEGVRNIDSFIVGYGKGKMACFPGDPQSVVDLIPADMVVNAMLAAMMVHATQPTDMIIYHVVSSKSNPVQYRRLQLYGLLYFTERPWMKEDGNPVLVRKAKELATVDTVQRYMQIHYLIPLKILSLLNDVSCRYFQRPYLDLARKVKFLMRMVELFSPYVFFKGVFDDMNTEKLRRMIAMEGTEMLYFDPRSIDWDDYFMYTHIAGVVKYAF